jgi:hypothetical protein
VRELPDPEPDPTEDWSVPLLPEFVGFVVEACAVEESCTARTATPAPAAATSPAVAAVSRRIPRCLADRVAVMYPLSQRSVKDH